MDCSRLNSAGFVQIWVETHPMFSTCSPYLVLVRPNLGSCQPTSRLFVPISGSFRLTSGLLRQDLQACLLCKVFSDERVVRLELSSPWDGLIHSELLLSLDAKVA